MGLVFLGWLWIAVVTLGLGKLLCEAVPAFAPLRAAGVEWVMLAGTCVLAWLLALVSFACPINVPVQLALTALAAGGLLWRFPSFAALLKADGPSYPYPVAAGILFFLYGLLTLVHAAQPPAFYDSGIYHVQFIKWIQNYAVVPGLGNLHGRFAFNAHVHLLSAFFSPAREEAAAFSQTFSSFLFLLFAACHLRQLGRCWRQRDSQLLFYAGSLVLVFIAYRPHISSPMPDSSVALLVLLILGLVLEKVKAQTLHLLDTAYYLLGLLFFTLLTFKLSAIYLGLVLLYLLWRLAPAQRRPFVKALALLGGVIGLPWVLRNVVLSGYLYYPFPVPDLLGLDWAIPAPRVQWELWEILYFNRWPALHWERIIHADMAAWFPFWLSRQERVDKVLGLAVILLSASLALLFRRQKAGRPAELAYRHLALLLALASAAWFFSAPAFRFGYGYLIGAALLALLAWLPPRLPLWMLYPVLLLPVVYAGNGLKNEIRKLAPRQLVWPGRYPPNDAVPQRLGGVVVWVPPSGRCWNAPLPCALQLAPNLELRGASLQAGFRVKPKYGRQK